MPATCSSAPRPGRPRRGSRPGTLAKALLSHLGTSVVSHVVQMGAATVSPDAPRPTPADLERVDESVGALLRPGVPKPR